VNSVRRTVSTIIGTAVMGAAFTPVTQAAQPQDDELEEVVITATRTSESINRVAVSVSAETQQSLDQQGIQTIADLAAATPGVRLTGFREASGSTTISIRGVTQQNATTPTTGFYLDETALQKRAASGFGSQNGTPIPPLFDLQRVEVLRGPQGTLFGGGSEGGTIRYLQPAPDLSGHSGYGRAQWNTTEGGDDSYEAGAAFGSAIIEDVLGFRVSVFKRKTGGYIDLSSWRTGQVYDENANSGEVLSWRTAVAWKPSESTKLTLSYQRSSDETDHVGTGYNLDEPGQLRIPSTCFNIPYILSQPVASRAFLVPPMTLPAGACATNPAAYIAPGYTVGPFNLERFQSLAFGPSPTRTDLDIGSADFQWDIAEGVQLKSISSFVQDLGRGSSPQSFPLGLYILPVPGQVITPGAPTINVSTGSNYNANVTASTNGLGLGAIIQPNVENRRNVFSQELRLTSTQSERVSYVAGAFFSNTRSGVNQNATASDLGFKQFSGMSIAQRYGVPFNGYFSQIHESVTDLETAAFGDLTVRLNEQWRVNAGVRVSYLSTSFEQSNFGPNSGTTSAGQATVKGVISDTPVTPKVSLQYFITPDDLVYVTAAKGFRGGGVNQVLTSAAAGFLANYALTTAQMPKTYESDSVWSYELGGKMRLWGGRAQINASIYDLEWSNMQQAVGAGDTVVFNVPSVRTRGGDVELTVRPFQPLTLNASVGYIEAEYTSSLIIPGGPGSRSGDLVVAREGTQMPQPAWTYDLGARYDLQIGDFGKAYGRVDYRWSEGYDIAIKGTPGYSPDSSPLPARKNVNLRLGIERGQLDLNVFALNVTDETAGPRSGGRSQCTNADCSTYTAYGFGQTVSAPTPRQVGVQVAYRMK